VPYNFFQTVHIPVQNLVLLNEFAVFNSTISIMYYDFEGSRDSSVSIVTRYGLDGPGSNPGGARFSGLVHTVSEPHPASYTRVTGLFPWGKAAGA
jgi:hypothetical protein